MAIKEWMLAGALAIFVGIGAGASLIIGNAQDLVPEEELTGNLTLTMIKPNLYTLTGDVGIGDCEKIVPQLPTTEPFTVILESPGGSLHDGVCLAAQFKLRNVITVVRDTPVLDENGTILYDPGMNTEAGLLSLEETGVARSICASSCSLMFMGGDERYLIGNVFLGIHAPRSAEGNGTEAQAYATAAGLLKFLEDGLGIESTELRRLFITIPANTIYNLNPDHIKEAPWLVDIATHYYSFWGFSGVNPHASIYAAARQQAIDLAAAAEAQQGG